MRTTEINGITFKVIIPKTSQIGSITHTKLCSGKDLFDYYKKPSVNKIVIYDSWEDWYLNTQEMFESVSCFGVTSGNVYSFTLGFLIEQNGMKYLGRITKTSNTLYQIN